MSDPFPVYYSVRDLSQRLGFCTKTIRAWIAGGEFDGPLAIVRINGDFRIPWPNVNRWLQVRAVVGPSPDVEERDYEERQLEPGIPARNLGELKRKLEVAR